MFQGKVVQELKPHFCTITLFLFENRAVCEIMWKNMVEWDRQHMRVWGMRIACWIPKATYTHSEYVIFIAFPLQQWLHERASMLRYTYIAFVCVCVCVCARVRVCVELLVRNFTAFDLSFV